MSWECLQERDSLWHRGKDGTLLWTWIGHIWESRLKNRHPACSTKPNKPFCQSNLYKCSSFLWRTHSFITCLCYKWGSWDWNSFCQNEHLCASLPSSFLPSKAWVTKGHATASCSSTGKASSWNTSPWWIVVHDSTAYVVGVNPDTALLAVDNALMDHRIMSCRSNLSGF